MTNYASEYIPKIREINKVKNGEKLKIGRNDENYSVFGFEVKLKRHSRPYIWLYFVPSTSVVIIAGNPVKLLPLKLNYCKKVFFSSSIYLPETF